MTEPETVPSPCTRVCVIDPVSGLCRGCRRSLDEIAAWGRLDQAARRRVLDQLPGRASSI